MAWADEYGTLSAEYRLKADVEVFKVVAEHFRNDFRMLWEHSSFFLIVQGGFQSVFVSVANRGAQRGVVTALGVLGFLLALMWWWVVTGRMHLVDLWRDQIVRLDEEVDRLGIFSEVERQVRGKRRFDSTWIIARFLPPAFAVSWVVLLLIRTQG